MRKAILFAAFLATLTLSAQPRGAYLVVDDKAPGIPVQPTMYGIFLKTSTSRRTAACMRRKSTTARSNTTIPSKAGKPSARWRSWTRAGPSTGTPIMCG